MQLLKSAFPFWQSLELSSFKGAVPNYEFKILDNLTFSILLTFV